MADSKKTGSRAPRRGRPPSKPTTIDLDATDVSKTTSTPENKAASTGATSAKTQSAESTKPTTSTVSAKENTTSQAASKEPELGRPEKKSSTNNAAEAKKQPSTPTGEKKPEQSKSSSGMISGLVGACLAVLGLGAVGQFEGASGIPLIGSIYGSSSSNNSDGLDLINARIDELAAAQNAEEATDTVNLAEISEKIAKLESGGDDGSSERLGALETQLGEVSTILNSLSETVADASSSNANPDIALAGVNSKITKLNETIADLEVPDTKPIQSAVEALQAELQSVGEEIAKNSSNISAINELAGNLTNEIETIKVSSQVAKTVAINGLGSALQNDDPLFVSISSLEALGGANQETIRLGELSREGIPTQKELVAELDAIANSVQNPITDTTDASITDKLWANARSLVTVQTSGPQEGNSAAAVLSRVKASTEKGDLEMAITEWKSLPPELSSQHAEWYDKVQKRAEAYQLYRQLSDQASKTAG